MAVRVLLFSAAQKRLSKKLGAAVPVAGAAEAGAGLADAAAAGAAAADADFLGTRCFCTVGEAGGAA
jgi:hypothetical protein